MRVIVKQHSGENPITRLIYILITTCTAIIGYSIHKSIFWAFVDFFFAPFVWIKWLLCKDVNLEIIKKAFDWFLK